MNVIRLGRVMVFLSLLMAYFNWVMYVRLHRLWKEAGSDGRKANKDTG